MTSLIGRVTASLLLAGASAGGLTTCSIPNAPTTPPAQSSKCDPGWVCTPGTSRCDPTYVCGTCPDTADQDGDGDSWSYLNDGSAAANEAQTDPKLDGVLNTRKPCG